MNSLTKIPSFWLQPTPDGPRGRLLNIFLVGGLLFAAVVIGAQIFQCVTAPRADALVGLGADLVGAASLGGLWALNRRGWTRLAALLFLCLYMAAITLLSPPALYEHAAMLYAFPILTASFLISPPASLGFALLAVGINAYLQRGNNAPSFNIIELFVIALLALLAYLVARHLEFEIIERQQAERELRASENRFRALVNALPNAVMVMQGDRYVYANPESMRLLGRTREEFATLHPNDFFHPDSMDLVSHYLKQADLFLSQPPVEIKIIHKSGTVIETESTTAPVNFNGKPATLIVARDISSQKMAQAALQESKQKLEAAEKLARLGNYEIERSSERMTWSEEMYHLLDLPRQTPPPELKTFCEMFHAEDRGEVMASFATCLGQNRPIDLFCRILSTRGEVRYVRLLARPVLNGGGPVKKIFGTLQDVTAQKQVETALNESKTLIRQRFNQLMVLHDIDLAITSTDDLSQMVQTILRHITQLSELNGAALLLPDETSGALRVVAHVGIPDGLLPADQQTWEVLYDHLTMEAPSGEPRAKKAAIFLTDLTQDYRIAGISLAFRRVFQSGAVLPLYIQDRAKGLLLIFSNQTGLFTPDWQEFMDALGLQTAIALENAELFTRMQSATENLAAAYEATIEGWSKALELRDRETRGHSERVTEWSQRLALAMHMPPEDMLHFKRGVLLHDIGKMGIPDSILLKPGPLTADEWKLMREHPKYAYDLLASVPFLSQSAEVPYCHHEKWDGSGYPRGLQGTQIPLGARIFALVDVWDALTSDRPYRPAWSKAAARDYLIEQSGHHFDPIVVETFVRLYDAGDVGGQAMPNPAYLKTANLEPHKAKFAP